MTNFIVSLVMVVLLIAVIHLVIAIIIVDKQMEYKVLHIS